MAIDKIIKIVEEEVEKEINRILSSAREESEKILREGKEAVNEEVESIKRALQEEYSNKLALEKLYIESEANKTVNKTLTQVFNAIYDETVKEIKRRASSLEDKKSFLLSLVKKSLLPASLNSQEGAIRIILSRDDFERYGEEVKKELEKDGLVVEVMAGEIEGGVMVKYSNLTVDASLERIIKMFDPIIVNSIYEVLPKVGP